MAIFMYKWKSEPRMSLWSDGSPEMSEILSSVKKPDGNINVLNSFPSPISRSNFKRTSDSILYDINMPHHSWKTLPTNTNTPLLLAATSLGICLTFQISMCTLHGFYFLSNSY